MRPDRVAVADEVLDDWNTQNRAAQHEEGPVEAASVEGHEAVEAGDRFPEFAQKHRLGVADEREKPIG